MSFDKDFFFFIICFCNQIFVHDDLNREIDLLILDVNENEQ